MTYAIISDIHANFEALERVLADAADLGAEKVICLGDIVGYGPLPKETLDLVRKTATLVVAGNHDDAVSGRIDAADFIELAGDAVRRHRAILSEEDIAWLGNLPYTTSLEEVLFVHGDASDPQSFNYVNSRAEAADSFAATNAQITFVGHTHVPLMHLVGRSGEVYRVEPQDFAAEDGKRYIVNVGSVGYPRENQGQCYSSYVLYDDETRSVRFRRLAFSVASLLQRGETPRRRLKTAALIGLGALALALASCAFLIGRSTDRTADPIVVEVAKETPVLHERSLPFIPSKKRVRANLILAKDSPPAHLTVCFLDDHANPVGDRTIKVVKQKYSAAIRIPEAAVSARFEVRAETQDRPPAISSFAPSAD